jgi:hypothetical protein
MKRSSGVAARAAVVGMLAAGAVLAPAGAASSATGGNQPGSATKGVRASRHADVLRGWRDRGYGERGAGEIFDAVGAPDGQPGDLRAVRGSEDGGRYVRMLAYRDSAGQVTLHEWGTETYYWVNPIRNRLEERGGAAHLDFDEAQPLYFRPAAARSGGLLRPGETYRLDPDELEAAIGSPGPARYRITGALRGAGPRTYEVRVLDTGHSHSQVHWRVADDPGALWEMSPKGHLARIAAEFDERLTVTRTA